MKKPARLLDLTRSLRRAGRTATGVDRVEHAYLDRFLSDTIPVFGLLRTPLGYLLLDREGLSTFQLKRDGQLPWGPASLFSRLTSRDGPVTKQAVSDMRRQAHARIRRARLAHVLQVNMPEGFEYYNVGHSNLTPRVLSSISAAGGTNHILIHDVIPLDYPQFQRPEMVEPFRKKMQRVGDHADRVIYNSQDTRNRAEGYFKDWGRVPDGIVAHLGTVMPEAEPTDPPMIQLPDQPYFVAVGTIEPRKNHAFLLDLWDEMGADAPPLLICGRRGWNNDAVFAKLDGLPADSPIQELSDLDDTALAHVIKHSAGMLFPSIAEGFGLPPAEALSLGTRVLCNDLATLREILGGKPVYAPLSDRYLWMETIKNWGECPPDAQDSGGFVAHTWDRHFNIVLGLMG